jgi:hypothetical protein
MPLENFLSQKQEYKIPVLYTEEALVKLKRALLGYNN